MLQCLRCIVWMPRYHILYIIFIYFQEMMSPSSVFSVWTSLIFYVVKEKWLRVNARTQNRQSFKLLWICRILDQDYAVNERMWPRKFIVKTFHSDFSAKLSRHYICCGNYVCVCTIIAVLGESTHTYLDLLQGDKQLCSTSIDFHNRSQFIAQVQNSTAYIFKSS